MYPFTSRMTSVTLLMMALLLPSCSGPGNSGDSTGAFDVNLSGLIVADHVSVVDPQQTGGGSSKPSLLPRLLGAVQLSDLPPASDYLTDRVTVYVNERSLDSFRSVNEILCSIRQSRYDVMVNKGPYRALVDKNLCSANRSNASLAGQVSTDQTGGATMPMYEEWTVNSVRASAASPHIVQVWVHSVEQNGAPPKLIQARLVITESADTAPPYGIFTANFKMFDPIADPGLTTALAKGFLNADRVTTAATSSLLLHFATEDKDSFIIDKATLDKKPDGTTGAGSAFRAESYPGITPKATRFNMAYDRDHFLRTENSGTNICLDRTIFQESAWRYGLYTTPADTSAAPGSRVTRNSNFQVKKQSGEYGSIGYWGAWFPNNATVTDGEPVFKHDYAANTDTPFTVFKRGGKLKKYLRQNVTLGDIKNVPLVLFASGTAYLVVWDGGGFMMMAQLQADGSWMTLTPQPLDLSALGWVDIMFWSQSLSGSVVVKLPAPGTGAPSGDCTGTGPFNCAGPGVANNSVPVVYFREQLIFPGDPVPPHLACFERCPDASRLDTANPFFSDRGYQAVAPALATYTSYSFNASTMMLIDGATGSPVTASTTTAPFENGITSGLLTEPTTTNLNLLACPWNTGNTCAGQAWTVLPAFYVWETGPNSWNQFVTVRDGFGNPVKFEPPLQVKYIHSQSTVTAPDHKYDGVTFFLQYQGFGDLQGIPGKCVDIDTGNDADCSNSGSNSSIRWVPEFTIPSSTAGILTEVADVARPSVTYLIKALEKEQRMSFLPVGACTGAGLTTSSYELPSMSSYVDPRLGPEPIVLAPPAVVGGVVQ